jgi:hypothetical protein
MEEIELKLKVLLERLQGIPKTEEERVYLESLIIALVSAKQIIGKVNKSYQRLENLETLLNTGNHIEALKWLEANPLPSVPLMGISKAKGVEFPQEMVDIGREMVRLIDIEEGPTALEVWAFLKGVYVGIGTACPEETCNLIAIQAITMTQEALALCNK